MNKFILIDQRGYLDSCLKYYDAYLPAFEETPLSCDDFNIQNALTCEQWRDFIERMDIIMVSNYWSYYDAQVPQQVSK